MKRLKQVLGIVGLGMAAAFLPTTTAQAEEADEEQVTGGIEEVVVTARRREETAQSVPIPISALSGGRLEGRGITEIQNVEQLTPNMSFNESVVARGTAQVFLRGIGQINWGPTQDPKVGIYVDGVYLGRPQGSVFDFIDIDRVEVLRGPQGTLFGRNTTAGLVHVITKKPDSVFDATVRGGFGNAGQLSADAMVNLPLIDDVLAARVAFQMRKDDGWMKDEVGREWNTTDSRTLRATLLWTPNDSVEVSLATEFFRARETGGLADCELLIGGPTGFNLFPFIFGVYDELEAACAADDNPYRSNDNDPNGLFIDTNSAALTVTWDFADMTLTSISAYRDMKELNESWGWGSDFYGGPSYHLEVLQDEHSPYDQMSQEFRLEGTLFSDRMTWITGVYGFTENAIQNIWVPLMRGLPPPDPADAPLWNAPAPAVLGFPTFGEFGLFFQENGSRRQQTDATNKSWAVFAEGTLDVTDAWSVTAGWRWTKDTREFKRSQWTNDFGFDPFYGCPGNIGPNGLAIREYCKQQVEYSQSTPRAIVNYDFTDDIMAYLSFSRGYSSGGMNGDVRMRPFLPEISDNWEVGMKSQWFERRLQFNLTVFRTDYENQQLTIGRVVDGQPIADLINAQAATIEGVEVEFIATPAEGWFVTGTYGYLDGEYDEFTVVDNAFDPVTFQEVLTVRDLSYISFIGFTPNRSWNLSVAKEFYLDNAGSLTAQVGYNYRGPYYAAAALTRLKRHRTEPLGLVDTRLRWDMANGRTSVSLWGTNMTDEEYYRGAQDLVDLGILLYYWAQPRRFGLTVEHKFGS